MLKAEQNLGGETGARYGALLGLLCAALILLQSVTAFADARTDYLVRLLTDSKIFRVRAQAALSLGKVDHNPRVRRALGISLNDKHPAVRLAAIASLQLAGDPEAISYLKPRAKDKNASVRRAAKKAIDSLKKIAAVTGRRGPGQPKYYVATGNPAAKAKGVDDTLLSELKIEIENQMLEQEGVVLAPGGQHNNAVKAILKKMDLRGFFLDTLVVSLRKRGTSTRAVVSVVVTTYPGRNIRAMVKGSATARGGDPSTRAQNAIKGATAGALRRVASAMEKARPGL